MQKGELKVAICLSGEVRHFTDELVVDGFQKYLETWKPDIFISTWDHLGRSMNHGYISPKEVKEQQQDLELYIRYIYPGIKAVEIENYNRWIDDMPKDEYNLAYSDRHSSRTINSYTQLYKIFKANNLKICYEKEQGIRYDIVLRARPDNLYVRPLALDEVQQKTIYNINLEGGAYYPNRIYDIFFYGGSVEMDAVCSSYLKFKELLYSPFNNGLCPRDTCRLLYLQAMNSGLSVKSTKDRSCDIYRGQTFEEYYSLLRSWGGLD
jgi:hypothetical protein